MNKIKIFISSRFNENKESIEKLKDNANCDIEIEWYYNSNNFSLSRLYKEFLEKNKEEDAILLLIHDDVEIITPNWGEKLLQIFNNNQEIGILGVAGSNSFNNECAWWNTSKREGSVYHRHKNYIWLSDFNPNTKLNEIKEVCVVDGLFIAINPKLIKHNFDEEFEGFDMYDIDFCLNNYLSKSCKIVVIKQIQLIHNSIGNPSTIWYENREKLKNKYKENLIINE